MKYQIKNRWNGAVQFEAEIECDDSVLTSVKIGLAVTWAYKTGADLSDADLRDASLIGADLIGADLRRANLSDADLSGADLSDADLRDAKIRDGVTVKKAPLTVSGLAWSVTILDEHMQIGCEVHSHDEWAGFSDDDWLRMGAKEALILKRDHYPALALLCAAHKPKE